MLMLSIFFLTQTMSYAQDLKKIPFDKGILEICSYKTLNISGYNGKEVVIRRLDDNIKDNVIVIDNLKNQKSKIKKEDLIKLSSESENNGLNKGLKPIGGKIPFQIEQFDNKLIIKDLIDDVIVMATNEKYEIMIPNSILLNWDTTGCHKNAQFNNSDSSILKDFNGEVQITSYLNSIELFDVPGPVSINTIAGNVTVEFNKTLPVHLYSIYSYNGDVNVKLSEKSNVLIDAAGYEILSDLDFTIVSEKAKIDEGFIIQQMKLKLGTGMVRMKLNTEKGNIYLKN